MTDYSTIKTDDLWSMADSILVELEKRITEEQAWSREAEEMKNLLGRIFSHEDEETYRLEITVEANGFCIEWKTEDSVFVEDWRRTDGGFGVPDKRLLERNPTLWLLNLKLGKYRVEQL